MILIAFKMPARHDPRLLCRKARAPGFSEA
jgi:hypothetical protein